MEINITDYLNQDEIKEVVESELRTQIRNHFSNEENANRLLVNLAYAMVTDELDKIAPNHKQILVDKVTSILKNGESIKYCLFNYDYNNGSPKSLGAKIIDETLKENKQVIKDKVIESITNRDYSEDAWAKFESLAEDFTHNIYSFVEAMRAKTSTP